MKYIGVTGFMGSDEVIEALQTMDGESRRLMVGVLASSKTLRGETNKHPKRFPLVTRIFQLFPKKPNTLNLVHYSTDDYKTIGRQLDLLDSLVTGEGGACLDGFQLNMCWPDPEQLQEARAQIGCKRYLILQLGGHAMNEVDRKPEEIVRQLSAYVARQLIEAVLIDPSGGLGKLFDLPFAQACLRALRREFPQLDLGVAGGLSAETLDSLVPLLEEFPNLNFDAEGRLRDAEDNLDLDKMNAYLKRARELTNAK